jgi:hypothetical protein
MTQNKKRLIFVALLFALALATSYADEKLSIVRLTTPRRGVYDVVKDGEAIARFDANDHLDPRSDEGLQNYYDSPESLPPLSPNHRFYPIVFEGNFREATNDGFLFLIDANSGAFVRKTIFAGLHLGSLVGVQWVNSTKLQITFGAVPRQLIFDIGTGKYRILDGLYALVMDSNGENYSSLWEEHRPRRGSPPPTTEQRSQYVRYNGYWVYPKPLYAFVTPEEFWSYEHGQNREKYPALKDPNYGSNRHYAFSKPVFVGDTLWVAFVEQVYESKRPDRLLDTNLVLLDAHRVTENPPDPSKVQVRKRPIPLLPVGKVAAMGGEENPEDSPYAYLSTMVTVDWTSTTQTLEIGKPRYVSATGKTVLEPFAQVKIDLAKKEIGEYRPVAARQEPAAGAEPESVGKE